jgi:predicted acetyltransferase
MASEERVRMYPFFRRSSDAVKWFIMELIQPNVLFKDEYLASLAECADIVETRLAPDAIALARTDFGTYVARLIGEAMGMYLMPGWVPASNYWLIDEGHYIGSVSVRHALTEHLKNSGGHIGYNIRPTMRKRGYGTHILRLALEKARELRLEKVLITCDDTNSASQKIIVGNGGIADTPYAQAEGKPRKLRYWITL